MEWDIALKKKIKMILFIILVFVMIYVIVAFFYGKPEKIEPDSTFEVEETIVK